MKTHGTLEYLLYLHPSQFIMQTNRLENLFFASSGLKNLYWAVPIRMDQCQQTFFFFKLYGSGFNYLGNSVS